MSHYGGLATGYAAALLSWLALSRLTPTLWPVPAPVSFSRPWAEVGWTLLATCATLGIGVLYSNGLLLPATSQSRPGLDAVNQILIYSPFLLLLVLRRADLATAWLPRTRIALRIVTGLGLALIALAAYTLVRAGSRPFIELVPLVYHPRNVSYVIQVLMEDISVAILFVRLAACIKLPGALTLAAALFAAAHVPGLAAGGATRGELASLVRDTALGVGALAVLQRAGDVWWFWGVHFAMDMTQFYAAP